MLSAVTASVAAHDFDAVGGWARAAKSSAVPGGCIGGMEKKDQKQQNTRVQSKIGHCRRSGGARVVSATANVDVENSLRTYVRRYLESSEEAQDHAFRRASEQTPTHA